MGILSGLGLARIGPGLGPIFIWLVLPLLLATIRNKSFIAVVLVLMLGISLGWWRGSVYMDKLASYEPIYMQKITLSAQASEDATYSKTKQLSFSAGNIVLDNGQKLAGKVQLGGFGANMIFQGDEVIATGKLYPGYGAYQGRISFAVIQVTKHNPSLLSEIRQRFVAGAQTALPEPLAPFVMGLLVGQRANLPQQNKDDLQKVGLTHIIAVSGANLTIIVRACQRMLGKRSKRVSTFLTLALIAVFLLLTGSSASIVRAAMVSVLSIAAGYYGRSFKPLNLILLAAVITAMADPVYLWSDLGWYLSFLAFFGVMILGPLVQARWPGKWHDSAIAGVALESICAEIMTLPFVLHIFGQMSRVGLVANVLVVAFIPLAMLLGTVAALAGMLGPAICGWFTWPATLLLNYMLDVAHVLAGLPNVFVEGIGLSLWQMLGLYGCIALFTAVLWYKNPDKSAIITDINESKSRGLLA
ncbi:MAG TPA: ComEC/Rec2 family competence protein [Methylomirabilota bacterium]|nr:ComEC/Rec2 family competence protein [Methylomirabilota bacterium]